MLCPHQAQTERCKRLLFVHLESDSEAALSISRMTGLLRRVRHLELRHRHLQELVRNERLILPGTMLRLSRHVRHNPVASREPRAVRQGAKMKLRRLRVLRSRRRRKRSSGFARQYEWTDGRRVRALVTAADKILPG